MNVPLIDEAEIKAGTRLMYEHGGIENVLDCVRVMQQIQIIILQKLNELILEDNENTRPN